MRRADELLYDANGIGDAIRMAQKEAWNEAINAAAETCCVQVDLSDRMFTSKESILRLLI